jgi:hypothetical protein
MTESKRNARKVFRKARRESSRRISTRSAFRSLLCRKLLDTVAAGCYIQLLGFPRNLSPLSKNFFQKKALITLDSTQSKPIGGLNEISKVSIFHD